MANPTKLTFNEPATNTDGGAFTRDQLAGYRVSFDNGPFQEVDEVFQTDGKVAVMLAPFNLAFGSHTARVVTVHKNGQVSVPSAPASFTLADERVPNPPTSLQAE